MSHEVHISDERAGALIKECQAEADTAIQEGNVPIACIITDMKGNVVVKAHNTQNTDFDPTAHAEINALRKLGKIKSTRYLDGHVVFSNAETCSMCGSACIKAHIRHFYYGAPAEGSMDPWITIREIAEKSKEQVEVYGPILGEACAEQIAAGREKIAR